MTSSNRLSYITGLDGIRAVAVMAVLFYHANAPWALGGFLGVETFFVLSGFLITALLLIEWQSTGSFSLKTFWLRRARRLLPAVWLLIALLPILAVFFARDALPRLKEDIPAALFYITNWVYIVREVPYFEAFGRPPLLQQLWSLAVEEQFYLLWPLILLFLLRTLKNHGLGLLSAFLVLTAISTLWMAGLYWPGADPLRIYYGTDTRAAGFLVGALLALLWSPGEERKIVRPGLSELLGWIGLAAVLFLYNQLNEFQSFLYRGGILLTALASALLIMGASSRGTWISKILETPLLRWIGSRSYSIYLWHWPVFMLTRPGLDIDLPEGLVRIGQIAITCGLAELSYRWIETPVRRQGFRGALRGLQTTFSRWSGVQKLGVGAGILTAALLLLWQGALHPVTASAPATEMPAAQQTFLPADISVTKPVLLNPQPTTESATRSPAKLTATPVIDNRPGATLIGDSIMQGAA